MSTPAGFPQGAEGEAIQSWWRAQGERGLLLLEVRVRLDEPGGSHDRRRDRRLDALHLPLADEQAVITWSQFDQDSLTDLMRGRTATIIEAKRDLNTDVIGQVVHGRDSLSRAYPGHGRLDMVVAVAGPIRDPALQWVADRRGIAVHDASMHSGRQDDHEHGHREALHAALAAIGDDAAAAELLVDYLDRFDGGHFETYGVNEPDRITGDDLVAVTMLSIAILRSTRSGISPATAVELESQAPRISELLARIPTDLAMEDLSEADYESVLGPGSDAWELWDALTKIGVPRVARHKLMARKRPALIPVHDSVIDRRLSLNGRSWRPWWTIVRDRSTIESLDRIQRFAGEPAAHLSRLRVADILLWRSDS